MSETAPVIDVDISTMTLDEACDVEIQSGLSLSTILMRAAMRRRLGLWLHYRRDSSENARSWQELGSLRIIGASSSTSPSSPAGVQATSAD